MFNGITLVLAFQLFLFATCWCIHQCIVWFFGAPFYGRALQPYERCQTDGTRRWSPLFIHRTSKPQAVTVQASPHCHANVLQPCSGGWEDSSVSISAQSLVHLLKLPTMVPTSANCDGGFVMWTPIYSELDWDHQLIYISHWTTAKLYWLPVITHLGQIWIQWSRVVRSPHPITNSTEPPSPPNFYF